MPTFDPEDLIWRTFLLSPEEKRERHRAKVTRKVLETIDTKKMTTELKISTLS